MKIPWAMAAALTLGLAQYAAADGNTEKSKEFCAKYLGSQQGICILARDYYYKLMSVFSLRELPKTEPREFRKYLSEEEREESLNKEDMLIIAHAKENMRRTGSG